MGGPAKTARRALDERGGVWVPRAYIDLCERDVTAAMLLSQIIFRVRYASVERDGWQWVTQTYSEWDADLGVCESTLRRKFDKLVDLGLIETGLHLVGDETRLHVRPVDDAIDAALLALDGAEGGSNLTPRGVPNWKGGGSNLADPSSPPTLENTTTETLVNFVDGSATETGEATEGGGSSTSLRSVSRARESDSRDERASAESLKGGSAAAVVDPATPDDGPTAIARRVLAAWVEAVGRDPVRTKMNAKRLSKVKARLREGYTEDDLIAAVRGIALSPFHMGDNPQRTRYDDMHVALRDGEQVEKFRDLYESGRRQRGRSGVRGVLGALDAAGVDDDTELSTLGAVRR